MQTTEPMWKIFMPPKRCAELAKMAQMKGRPFGASERCRHCMHDPLVAHARLAAVARVFQNNVHRAGMIA